MNVRYEKPISINVVYLLGAPFLCIGIDKHYISYLHYHCVVMELPLRHSFKWQPTKSARSPQRHKAVQLYQSSGSNCADRY